MSVLLPVLALWLLFMNPGKKWFEGQIGSYRLTDEALYAEALREMQAGQRHDGLWAKALADCNMHINAAQAQYMKLRVVALRGEIERSQRSENRIGVKQKVNYLMNGTSELGNNIAKWLGVALLALVCLPLIALLFGWSK